MEGPSEGKTAGAGKGIRARGLTAAVLLAACLVIAASCFSDRVTRPGPDPFHQDDGSLEVLMIGSSYFSWNDLPGLLRSLAATAGKKVHIETSIVNGRFLDYHAVCTNTAYKIGLRKWDFVFLQGVCVNAAYPEEDSPFLDGYIDRPLMPALITLEAKIHANWDSTRIAYCLPWAFEDGMTWRGFEDETYEVMQQRVIDNTLLFAEQLDIVIAPVGVAWQSILAEPDVPLHYLHLSDWNHPSGYGTYLTACVIYTVMFGETIEGNGFYDGIDRALALHFQQVGSSTVLSDMALWKLGEGSCPAAGDGITGLPLEVAR